MLSGQLQKSVTYGERALEIAQKIKDPIDQLWAIGVLIAAYRSVRNFDSAAGLIEKGFGIVQEIPSNTDPRLVWEGALYNNRGTEHMRRREYEKAIDAFSQAVRLQKAYLGRERNQSYIEEAKTTYILWLTRLGNAYRQTGEMQQALEQYQQALGLVKEWGLKYAFENDLYWNIGEAYRRLNRFRQALENFEKALSTAQNQNNPSAIRDASARIGDVLRQMGKPTEAVPYYQKAVQQIESTRSLLQAEEYRQSYFEGGLGAYISMMDALVSAGDREEAFNYSERARSRVFLDVLGSKAQLSRAKSGLLEEERSLQERIASVKARLTDEEPGEQRENVRRELREAESAYNAFLSKVRKQDKEQASLMTVEPLTVKAVQELLDPGTTLIEYFVTNSNIHVWVVEKEKSQYLNVPLRREDLSKQVKALRESIYALGEKEKFSEVSRSLYKSIIQPLLSHIGGKEMIIVPHDVLHYLPFHALLSPDGKYLIERYPIYYLSSASLLQFTKEKRRAGKSDKVLALGNPDLGDPKMNLDFAELEAKEIQGLYPQSTVFLKKEATEEKSKTLSPQYDILHFATHAELSEEDPLSSAILLAREGKEDGRLEVREIFGMDLHASLVVLSACETGLGKLSSGDELVGLTRAFIYAGTPSVVASLWKVEDSSTAALMASFYKNLKTMSKVEALRQAQLALITGKASSDLLARRGVGGIGKLGEVPEERNRTASSASISTSHPFFWAPFILVGDGK